MIYENIIKTKTYTFAMAMSENDLISEFMKISNCDRIADAISCLSAWNWDLKKALIDYNGN